jgi:hypothetical protein
LSASSFLFVTFTKRRTRDGEKANNDSMSTNNQLHDYLRDAYGKDDFDTTTRLLARVMATRRDGASSVDDARRVLVKAASGDLDLFLRTLFPPSMRKKSAVARLELAMAKSTFDKTHAGKKSFGCTEPGCGKAFTRKSNLKRHVRRMHADEHAISHRRVQGANEGNGLLLLSRAASVMNEH